MLDLTIQTKDKTTKEKIEEAYNQAIKEIEDIPSFIKSLRKKITDFEVSTSGVNIYISEKVSKVKLASILI